MGKLDYRTLRENVADEIRMKILNGDMKPGDKIIEQELASEFGISRGPVREALRQLEQEGMVEYSRNVGCSVKHIGMDDVYEIYYMRANYEMMAVRLYNAPFPRETIEKMEQVLEQMKQLHKEEYRKVFELDNEFHEAILDLVSFNPRGRFYFEAFQPDNEINNQGNNFDLTVKDGDLFVSTVWSSTKGKIAVGDKVVKINGKPAKKYDFCESILNGIPELKEKKKTKLTIETASGVKDIIYEKE